ncbi:MAG: ParB/RepB/Spo0J family partition protein [Acidimicrobiia bacterium]
MAAHRPGLGRGLDALLPAEVEDGAPGWQVAPLAAIDPNPTQPRRRFDDDSLRALTASIAEVGVLQPVIVRPMEGGRYRLVAGERRLRAAQEAGLEEIPIFVRQRGDDTSDLAEALIENIHREDLNPLEEAAAYRQLLDDFGLTHEEAGRRVGKSRSAISNMLRLLQLPPQVQALLGSGVLSAGHARALLGLEDPAEAVRIAQRAVTGRWSVRQVEEGVRRTLAGHDGEPRRSRPAPVIALEQRLAERLETGVRIDVGSRGGRVTIRFGSVDELERIYGVLFGS